MAEESEQDDCLGIILRGYDGEQARIIEKFLSNLAGRDVFVYGADDDDRTVREIIEGAPGSGFESGDIGMLMFLGFDDELIDAALRAFPKDGLKRPIFCTLTENNMNWTVSQLMEHLLEEKREWERREKGGSFSD